MSPQSKLALMVGRGCLGLERRSEARSRCCCVLSAMHTACHCACRDLLLCFDLITVACAGALSSLAHELRPMIRQPVGKAVCSKTHLYHNMQQGTMQLGFCICEATRQHAPTSQQLTLLPRVLLQEKRPHSIR